MIVLLTINFYYRYLSVTCPAKLTRFSAKNSPIWVFLILFNSSTWFVLSYFVNGPTSMKDEILQPELLQAYCMQPEDYAYVGPQYFYKDEGEMKFHLPSWIASGGMAFTMFITNTLLTYFGIETYRHLNKIGSIAGIEYRELQRQLFRTLVIQTAIPMVFMYFPISCMFLFPIFGIKAESLANVVPIAVAIYPCFEPLAAMYCIKSFQKRIFSKFSVGGSCFFKWSFQVF